MLGLFKRRKAEPEGLPLSVESALAGLSVVCRPAITDDDGRERGRILLEWANSAGVCGWHHDNETTRRKLAEAFPSLTPGQLDLALHAVNGMVRAAQQEGMYAPKRKKSEWASWAPARRLSELPGLPDPRNF